jgi:hypothetical protein
VPVHRAVDSRIAFVVYALCTDVCLLLFRVSFSCVFPQSDSEAAAKVRSQYVRQQAMSSVLTRPSAKHGIGVSVDDLVPPPVPEPLAVDSDPAFNRQWKWKTLACPLMVLVNVPLIVLDDYILHRSLSLKLSVQVAFVTSILSATLIGVESPLSCLFIRASARSGGRRSRRVADASLEGPGMAYLRSASQRRAAYAV